MSKRRSLAGNFALAFFVIAFITIVVSFSTPSWLVSDNRITNAKLDRLGLWMHCFRSLEDPQDQYGRRFFVGCRLVYDPFTTGYDKIRGYLIPGFMVATQLFYTLCFIAVIIAFVLTLMYFLCCGPDQARFINLVNIIAVLLLGAAISGAIAIIVFASCANKNNWMPGHNNNFFGWSFILACIGVVAALIASVLFFVDGNIYRRKERNFKESQTRFGGMMHVESKA